MDRVYRSNIPALRAALEELREEFSGISSQTDWSRLRVQPLLRHATELETQLESQGTSRLTRGVAMFHSDLVYLRENVVQLKQILASERKSLRRGPKTTGR